LQAFWASLSFFLVEAIVQPIYTSTSDILGRLWPLYFSIVVFCIGCVVFALAKTMSVLILGRVIQGVGAGGLDVLTHIILMDITTMKERPLYIGLFTIPMALGSIWGPLIGAAFSEYVDWTWIGWVNLPIAATGFLLAFFFMKLEPMTEFSVKQKLRRIDWIGIALYTVGATMFALPLSWAGSMYSWKDARTIVPLILGALVLFGFAIYEKKPLEPVFPYRIFANKVLCLSLFMSFLHGTVFYTAIFYVPLFLQAVFLESPFQSAISILPLAASVVFFTVCGAVVVEIIRQYKWAIVVSWTLSVAGIGLWMLWRQDSSAGLRHGLQIVAGAGLGALFSILFIPVQAAVEHVNDTGLAIGISTSFRVFGGLVGLAIASTIFNNVFEHHMHGVGDLPVELVPVSDAKEAIAYIPVLALPNLDTEVVYQVINVYRAAFQGSFYMLIGSAAIGFGLPFSWWI
jgi:MFS family permease